MIYKNALINNKITSIVIRNGKIAETGDFSAYYGEKSIDLNGMTVIPGHIDIHSHGCIGYDTMDGGLAEMSEYLITQGVCSWYPTTMTASFDDIRKACSSIPTSNGTVIEGFHMEGPYISKKKCGAQNTDYIRPCSFDEFTKLENIKLVTIAPETDGAMDFISKCSAVVCLGHTECDYDTAVKAFDNGAKCVTHLMNAMPAFLHRAPSLTGAAMDCNAYVQVICDGLHIHPSMIRALYRLFGSDRMILISDSMRATGLSDGEYMFGGQKVIVKNSEARLTDGTIAGSTSTLHTCFKNAIEYGIPFGDAVKMSSTTPAKLMGLNKGLLLPGYDADLIVLDNELDVKLSVISGEIIYQKK